eukprot:g2009.t1
MSSAPSYLSNVTILKHRSLRALFSIIRDKSTTASNYIVYCDRLCNILAEEGLAHLSTVEEVDIQTPCGVYKGLKGPAYTSMCAVSIMRSGDILLEAVRKVALGIAVGKVLIQRDEEDPEKKAKLYYSKLPSDISSRQVLLVDPMIATGGSVIKTIEVLVKAGVPEENITFLNVVSAPEGLEALYQAYPKVRTVTAALDEGLNEDKYITPGLGDFGDRYYST